MDADKKLGLLNLTVFVLTLYVLGALVIETFYQLPQEISKLLSYFDYVICAIFMFDFFYRLIKAENKLSFLKWGWIDLLSSIPMLDYFRAGRILRLIRLIRIIRAFRSTRQLLSHVFKNKLQGTLNSVFILTILLIIFSSIAILEVENDVNSNIKTAEDAVWWTYTTITTVGYGDRYPVTTEGRLLAMILMTFGVGLFGTFTAYFATVFAKVENSKDPDKENDS